MRIALVVALLWTHTAIAQPLMNPVSATCISSPFGPRYIPNHPEAGTFHRGIDLPVPEGTPVWAAAAGTVFKVQHQGVGGFEVLVKHSNGLVSVYSHLGSVSNRIITNQTPVSAGELIGYVGHTGLTFGPHLYFGVLYEGVPIDPAPIFDLPPCATRISR